MGNEGADPPQPLSHPLVTACGQESGVLCARAELASASLSTSLPRLSSPSCRVFGVTMESGEAPGCCLLPG